MEVTGVYIMTADGCGCISLSDGNYQQHSVYDIQADNAVWIVDYVCDDHGACSVDNVLKRL